MYTIQDNNNYNFYCYLCVFQCILVGDSEGQVTVYQMRSMPAHADVSSFHSFKKNNQLHLIPSNFWPH